MRTKNKQAKRTRRAKRGTLHPFLVCFRECVRRFSERLTQRENQLRLFLLNLFGEIFCFLRGAKPLSKLLEIPEQTQNFGDTFFSKYFSSFLLWITFFENLWKGLYLLVIVFTKKKLLCTVSESIVYSFRVSMYGFRVLSTP